MTILATRSQGAIYLHEQQADIQPTGLCTMLYLPCVLIRVLGSPTLSRRHKHRRRRSAIVFIKPHYPLVDLRVLIE